MHIYAWLMLFVVKINWWLKDLDSEAIEKWDFLFSKHSICVFVVIRKIFDICNVLLQILPN